MMTMHASGLDDHAVFDILDVAIAIVDRSGHVRDANASWRELVGIDLRDGAPWLQRVERADRSHLLDDIRDVATDGGSRTTDVTLSADARWSRTRWSIRAWHGAPFHALVSVIDITADHARETELSHRARHDALTGMLNRAEMRDHAERSLARLDGSGRCIALLYIDLDGFKVVNDTGGHAAGDQVLAKAARRIQRAVRPGDVVTRVGGDEFVVLCEDLDDACQAVVVAERIEAAFVTPIEVQGRRWAMGVTVGVASTASPRETVDSLLEGADRAMYAAKASHRYRRHDAGDVIDGLVPKLRDLADRINHFVSAEDVDGSEFVHLFDAAHHAFAAVAALEAARTQRTR